MRTVPTGAPAPEPAVSVVTPVFERPGSISRIVDVLQRQTLTDWELIFVDDGSRADIAGAVAPFLDDPRIRFVRLDRNGGPSVARNRGIAASRGRYVAFLDSDDSWAPEKLERQVALIEAEAAAGPAMCVTLTTVEMPGGWRRLRPAFFPARGEPFAEYLYGRGGFAQMSSLMVTRDLLASVRFPEPLRQYEDHYFYMACHGAGARYLVVEEPLTIWDNQPRDDRLSRADDLDRGAAFVEASGPLMTPRARLAFGLRILGPIRLKREPAAVSRDAVRAVLTGSINPRALAAMVVNAFAPRALRAALIRRVAP